MIRLLRHRAVTATAYGAFASFLGYQYFRVLRPATNTLAPMSLPLVRHTSAIAEFQPNNSDVVKAISQSDVNLVRRLIQTDPELLTESYEIGGMGGDFSGSILDYALFERRFDVAQTLVECGADLDSLEWVDTLIMAAKDGHIGLIKAVLARKPEMISVTDEYGNTVLFHAIPQKSCFDIGLDYHFRALGQIPVMRLLLDAGADPNHQNNSGATVHSILEDRGLFMIGKLLTLSQRFSGCAEKFRP